MHRGQEQYLLHIDRWYKGETGRVDFRSQHPIGEVGPELGLPGIVPVSQDDPQWHRVFILGDPDLEIDVRPAEGEVDALSAADIDLADHPGGINTLHQQREYIPVQQIAQG